LTCHPACPERSRRKRTRRIWALPVILHVLSGVEGSTREGFGRWLREALETARGRRPSRAGLPVRAGRGRRSSQGGLPVRAGRSTGLSDGRSGGRSNSLPPVAQTRSRPNPSATVASPPWMPRPVLKGPRPGPPAAWLASAAVAFQRKGSPARDDRRGTCTNCAGSRDRLKRPSSVSAGEGDGARDLEGRCFTIDHRSGLSSRGLRRIWAGVPSPPARGERVRVRGAIR
jgi:hypothetical protein